MRTYRVISGTFLWHLAFINGTVSEKKQHLAYDGHGRTTDAFGITLARLTEWI